MTADHLGSARVITNQNGAVTTRKDYAAFGEELATAQRTSDLSYDASETRKGYTGYEKDDESGLEFAQARYYNTTHGRFTSVDPLTASATIKNPQTFNRYSYVLNSPYKFTDPLGLISSSTGACGSWCPNSGGSVDGSAFRGRDASFDWAEFQKHAGSPPSKNYQKQLSQETKPKSGKMPVFKVRIQDPSNLLNSEQRNAMEVEISRIYREIEVDVQYTNELADFYLTVTEDNVGNSQSGDAFGSIRSIEDPFTVLNFAVVYVNKVKELATTSLVNEDSQVALEFDRGKNKNLGIALGRAAAHEIGHFLLQLKHEKNKNVFGIMAKSFRGLDWFSESAQYTQKWKFTPDQKTKILSRF